MTTVPGPASLHWTKHALVLTFTFQQRLQLTFSAHFTLYRSLPAAPMRFPTSFALTRLRPCRATGCARVELAPRHAGEPSRTLPLAAARRPI